MGIKLSLLPLSVTVAIETRHPTFKGTIEVDGNNLKVNGKTWDKAWVAWEDVFEKGGTMEYVMGTSPSRWATGELPPSPASL